MKEVYFDEKKNKEPGGNFEPSPPPPPPPGNGFGGGAGWSEPEPEDPDKEIEPEWIGKDAVPDKKLLRVSASGRLMVDADGKLIFCRQLCAAVPGMLIYLKKPEGVVEAHDRCIQCHLVYTNLNPLLNYPDRQLEYELWPEDLPTQTGNFYAGSFPLPDPGEKLQVKLKWQNGHYDVNDFSQMKVVLFGQSCGYQTFSLSKWKRVADIYVNQDRHIFVNNVRAKLRGNE